jgi:hypothetical protein
MKKEKLAPYENKPYNRTRQGLCYTLYYDQCRNSKQRGHNNPKYDKVELFEWITSQSNFETIYNDWVKSNYESDLRPSCDRLDNSIGYSFDNIELITWKENKLRANLDVIDCKIMLNQTKVYQYSTSGRFIKLHNSIADACRKDESLDQRNITACCQGKIPTAYGYKWSYTDLGLHIEPLKVNDTYLCEIFQYDPFSGDIINIYESILDVPEPQYSRMKIRNVIQGVYKTHEGFFWSKEYLSPDDIKVDTKYLPRRIQQLSINGNVVKIFESMSEASKATGVGSGNISKVCNGISKTAGGYVWKYDEQ